jgi:trigger factor
MAENEKKNSKYEGMTASKAKRERQKEEREKDKRAKVRSRVIAGLVVLAIVGCIGAAYGRQWYKEKNKIKPSTDYSAMLNEDGTIQNVNVTDYVKDFDVNSVKIAAADVAYTDEDLQMTSRISIDYVGTMDGVEFDGGSAQDYRLTIGSGSFIDNFEDQLIGTHPGDKVTVNVTFPDPYENNPDYAGKAASFAVTVKGIYETAEFNDEFVKKNLSSYAETAEAYKQYLKDTNYDNKLSTAIDTYIKDNISADKYPDDYLKHLQSLQMTIDEEEYNYMAQMYSAYGMDFPYTSVMEYKGASTEDAYQEVLKSEAENSCLNNMAYQDLAAQAGITATDDQYKNFITENEVSDEVIEQYGKPYIVQQYILPGLVKDYIKEHVTVE